MNIKKPFKTVVEILPIVMLLVTAVTAYISSIGWYSTIFAFLPDILGYSVFTNVVFIFIYFRRSFCIPTKLSVLGLLAMNVLSISLKAYELKTGNIEHYNQIYDVYITLIVFVVALFFKFKRF